MSKDVSVIFYNNQLQRLFSTTQITNITWTRTVNKVGTAIVEIPEKAIDIDYDILTQEDLVMVIQIFENGKLLQPDMQTAWFIELFTEFHANKEVVYRYTMKDTLDLLKRRVNAYPADDPEGTSPQSIIDSAGNIAMRDIINNNYGGTAEPARRIPQLTVAPITNISPFIEKEIAYKNILSVFQQIARTSADKGTRLFFDIVAIPTNTGLQFEFRTYINQRGSDKRGQELIETTNNLFSLNAFVIDYDIPSVAYVGGSGKGQDRLIGFADTRRATSGVFSRREIFKTEQSAIQQVLDDEASELVSDTGTFRLDGTLLGELADRYQFGDVLTVHHKNLAIDVEIASVRNTWRNQEYEKKVIVKSII